jgi:hypothetical protein
MSSQNYADRLSHMLNATGMAQTVNTRFREGQVTVLFRVKQGSEAGWNSLVKSLLRAEKFQRDGAPHWAIDVSKPYMLKDDDTMVFGWRMSIQSADMSSTLDAINSVLKGEEVSPRLGGEIMEMPFTGMDGRTDRNIPKNRKGVYMVEGKKGLHPLKGDEP